MHTELGARSRLQCKHRLQCKQQRDVLCRRRETGISAWLLPLGTELKMNLCEVGVTGRSIQRVFWFHLVGLYVVQVQGGHPARHCSGGIVPFVPLARPAPPSDCQQGLVCPAWKCRVSSLELDTHKSNDDLHPEGANFSSSTECTTTKLIFQKLFPASGCFYRVSCPWLFIWGSIHRKNCAQGKFFWKSSVWRKFWVFWDEFSHGISSYYHLEAAGFLENNIFMLKVFIGSLQP